MGTQTSPKQAPAGNAALRILPSALFALLLFAGALFSQTFEDFRNQYGGIFQSRMGGWQLIAIASILVCLFANTLVYMAGYLFQSEHLKRYASSEFLQVSASALMIFFAVELLFTLSSGPSNVSGLGFMGEVLGTGSSIDCAAMPGGKFMIWQGSRDFGSGPLGAFKCKVQEKINALDSAYNNVVEGNKPLERTTSICFNLFGVPVYCWDWNLDLHNQVEKNHLVATKIVSLLMPLHAQFSLAEYLQKNMLAVFLPAGFVMRIFPFTRGVGGLFIALAIGFFFIFPTFFLLTDPTFVKADAAQAGMEQGACYTGFKGASVLLAGVFGIGGSAGASELATTRAEELVFQITIGTLFYPFVALALTLMFVRAMTPVLGGDLGELMKMVARLG
ncbi:Uncharacterised protein [Candidatus Burarchaeum australiense]|nr:Uncharacterised protein [Candidatus Burarchaeum australiense]